MTTYCVLSCIADSVDDFFREIEQYLRGEEIINNTTPSEIFARYSLNTQKRTVGKILNTFSYQLTR